MLNLRLNEARGFVEEFGIHIMLEVTLVGIIDNFLRRKWRGI